MARRFKMFNLYVSLVDKFMATYLAKSFWRHHCTQDWHKRAIVHLKPEKFESCSRFSRRCSCTVFDDSLWAVSVLFLVKLLLLAILTVGTEGNGRFSTTSAVFCFPRSEPRMMPWLSTQTMRAVVQKGPALAVGGGGTGTMTSVLKLYSGGYSIHGVY